MTPARLVSVVLVLSLMGALSPSLAAGQDKRTATPADNSAEKPSDPEQPEPGIRGWIKKRLSDDSERPKEGFSMKGGIIVAGSGLAAGAGYRRLHVADSRIGFEADAIVSIRRYQEYRLAVGRIDARTATVELDTADARVGSLFNDDSRKVRGTALYLDTRYRNYPRHTFYGEGIDSREENKSDYALTGVSVEGVWQRQITSQIGLSARAGVLGLDVGIGRNDALVNFEERFPVGIPGAVEQPQFITFGAGLVRDTRRQLGAPEDGTVIGVALRRYAARNSDLAFTRLSVDARAYTTPFARGVIALRGLVSTDLTADGASTPFYLQQSLGGGETLRGFHSYRFQDQALAHVTAEYRLRVHRFVELAPFIDAGTVAPALSGLTFGSLKATPGIGIRARTDRRSLARLDVAFSDEGYRISFGTGAVF